MSMSAPITGSGLGSFEPVFSLFHHALGKELMGNLHPESDWLWMVDEMGWPALLILLGGVFFLVKGALPLNTRDRYWYFRAAGIAAGLMFFLHGCVDVPGHRFGSFLVAIFAFSFSAPEFPPSRTNEWIPRIFRIVGVVLIAAGSVWVAATVRGAALPGTMAAEKAGREAVAAYTNSRFADAIGISTQGLRWEPMGWQLYYDRAVGEALVDPPRTAEARADFLRARFLQPTASELPYNEGLVWINELAPALVLQAWQEALRRVPDDQRKSLYGAMLGIAGTRPELRDPLRQLAGKDTSLVLAYLAALKPENSLVEIESLLRSDPGLDSFTAPEKKMLFELWAEYGDRSEVTNQIAANGKWLAVGWPLVMANMASAGNYEEAYQVCRRFATLPEIPGSLAGDASNETIQAEYYSNPGDFLAALSMYDIYRKAGDWAKAAAVLDKVTSQNACPSYFFLLKAELLASHNQWQKALESLLASQANNQS